MYLKLGRVFTANGEAIEEFSTLISDQPILLRGGDKSSWDVCQYCGRFRYAPTGDHYVLRESVTGQPVYQSYPIGGLVVVEELRRRIEPGRWKGIYIEKLSVIDEPRDGIKSFPKDFSAFMSQVKT
jgi:hypothetical protein